MGYYLRMEEILSLQLKSQEQIERWKEELQEVWKNSGSFRRYKRIAR